MKAGELHAWPKLCILAILVLTHVPLTGSNLWNAAEKPGFLLLRRQRSKPGAVFRVARRKTVLPRPCQKMFEPGDILRLQKSSYGRQQERELSVSETAADRAKYLESALAALRTEPGLRACAAGCLTLLVGMLISAGIGINPGSSSSDAVVGLYFAVAAFLFGRASVSLQKRERHWLENMLKQTHGAAVLYALTTIGVMDALPDPEEDAMEITELASRCGLRGVDELRRLLLFLNLMDIVEWERGSSPAKFRHTKRSQELCQGGNARTFALVHFAPAQVRPWWRIQEALSSIEHGKSVYPFRLEHAGLGPFEFYRDPANAKAAQCFNELMQELSEKSCFGSRGKGTAELVSRLPLWSELSSESPVVVDVAGGSGHVLAAVLKSHPSWHGVIFDQPHVITPTSLNPMLLEELASRVCAVGGDFFAKATGLPGHADVYMLKRVLHDWDDDQCHQILSNIRTAIVSQSGSSGAEPHSRISTRSSRPRLLIIEVLRLDRDSADVDMWVIYGGKERVVKDYSDLLWTAGFSVSTVTRLPGNCGLVAIEAEIRIDV